MTKAESEKVIRSLCHDWAHEQSTADLVHPSFVQFKRWLETKRYSHYLRFQSRAGPEYDAEMWFDNELRETRRHATVAHGSEILDKLKAAMSPTTCGTVSLREIIGGLERLAVTNDEHEALRKLKEAGDNPDPPLIDYVRAVFAKRFTGVDGWPMK